MRRTLAAIFVVLTPVPAFAQQIERPPPSITVEGRASASVVPDTAVIAFGVVTDRPAAADAAAINAAAVRAVVDALKGEGIDPHEIRTTSVDLAPVLDDAVDVNASPRSARPGERTDRIQGFRATNMLEVRVRPVERAGALLGTLIDKGANTIEGVAFEASTEARTLDGLRADAVRDARREAQTYVDALGLKLGPVLLIAPGATAVPAFRTLNRAMASPALKSVPLEGGSQTIEADVSVTWGLVQ